MKITQISNHIWSLKTWVLIPIHVWLVEDQGGLTLVDTGISTMGKGIIKAIDRLQVGPLKRIILTHGHSDHVGSLSLLLNHYDVPIYAHQVEIPYIEGKIPYHPSKAAKKLFPEGTIRALPVNENGGLLPIGGLTPYFAPGHSPGHTVYYHNQDDVLLAGDLFWSKKGKLRKPRFTPNIHETIQSSNIVSQLQPFRLEVCHGESVFQAADQIAPYMAQ